MHLQQAVLLALSLAATGDAARAMKQVETVTKNVLAAQGWMSTGDIAVEQELTLQIGLTLQNTDVMVNRLLDVSSTKSKNYGKWLDRDEVNAIVQPSKQANDAVLKWLQSEGVNKVHSDGTWVTFQTNVDTANRILSADFRDYEREGIHKIRTTEYSVPQDVFEHIDIIHPTTFFGKTEAFKPVHFPDVGHDAFLKARQAPALSLAPAPNFGSAAPVQQNPPQVQSPPAQAQPVPAQAQPPVQPRPVQPPPVQAQPVPAQAQSPPVQPRPVQPPPVVPASQAPPAQAPRPSSSNLPSNVPAGIYEQGPAQPKGPVLPQGRPWPFTVDPACNRGITPACIKQMYNINYTAGDGSPSRVGFGSFLNQSANIADAFAYQQYYKLPIRNFTKIFVNNATNNQDPDKAQELGGEAGLDVQTIMGTANPLPVYEILTAGSPPFVPDLEMNTPDKNTNEPYVPYFQFLLSKRNSEIPQVLSQSYGEPEQTVPYRYAVRTCQMIAQLGLRGVTVMESSGDTGVGSYCRRNDGTNRPTFLPSFPASCPWITAIGGTEGVAPEIAWRDSSGGFSYYFKQPAYQRTAVNTYLYRALPRATVQRYAPYFDPSGRAFPDVSAHSLYPAFRIVYGGYLSGSGGTSASAPVVAGIIGLLNDARLRTGQPSLGFINPWLYEDGNEFLVDITQGAARGCDGTNHQSGNKVEGAAVIPNAYWNATVGWDAVTGLGIFDFQKALNNVLENDDDDDE